MKIYDKRCFFPDFFLRSIGIRLQWNVHHPPNPLYHQPNPGVQPPRCLQPTRHHQLWPPSALPAGQRPRAGRVQFEHAVHAAGQRDALAVWWIHGLRRRNRHCFLSRWVQNSEFNLQRLWSSGFPPYSRPGTSQIGGCFTSFKKILKAQGDFENLLILGKYYACRTNVQKE